MTMSNLSKEKIENSFGDYVRGKPETVPYPEIVTEVDLYRKHVAQRFITRREADIPTLIGKEFIISVKVDGAFSGYYYDQDTNDSFFFNLPAHRIFIGLPVAKDLEVLLKKNKIKKALLVGEFHASFRDPHDFETRSTIHDLMKIRRNPQSIEDLEKIGYKVFDILQLNATKWINKDFPSRFQKMIELFPEKGRLSMVTTKICTSVYEIQDFYRRYVIEQGQEGIIVRVGNTGYKIKPIQIIDVAIIGVASGREDTEIAKDQVATCLVALRYPDGTYQILSRVGGGLGDMERTKLWSEITMVDSKGFAYSTNDGRIYSMITPQKVGQIEYFDIITDHDGEPIMEPSLKYNPKTKTWEMVRMLPFVRLLSPHFVEGYPFREDKSAETIEDVRIRQILDVIELSRINKVSKLKLKPSEIIAKKVYQRQEIAVKKFMTWKTNKEDSGFYPKYVIYFLDYSKGRKDPLSRKAKVTNDEEQMTQLYEEWIQNEMIGTTGKLKKGWKEIK
jgi:hypothetical protein